MISELKPTLFPEKKPTFICIPPNFLPEGKGNQAGAL